MSGAALADLDSLDLEAVKELARVQQRQLCSRETEIEHLKLLLAKLRRMLFGARSEKLVRQVEQMELQLEELELVRAEEPVAELPPAAKTVTPEPVLSEPARRALPEHLPRETHTHLPGDASCPGCGGALRRFGEDVAEVLERVPESFKPGSPRTGPRPWGGRSSAMYGPSSAAHAARRWSKPSRPRVRSRDPTPGPACSRMCWSPSTRTTRRCTVSRKSMPGEGVELDRSTLAGWVGASSALLAPLVEAVRAHVLSASKLHADDTPVPVLAPGHGRTKTGRLWTYVRDDRPSGATTAPAVWFAFSPDRRGEHPQGHLGSFRGTLQADAYAGFHPLYESGRIVEAACWAHARRKFHDILAAAGSALAEEAVRRIGALYAIEKEVRGSPPEIRLSARRARAKPVIDDLRRWLEETLKILSAKSEMAGAIRYALSRWPALTRYLEDGAVELDNNAAERALRAVAIGRKNYLFAGSNRGGERAAALYSLIGTAKLNGLDPERYLRQVLTRTADHPVCRVAELLPWNITCLPHAALAADTILNN